MQTTLINRTTVPVEGIFPVISDFPMYERPHPKVAVLIRLFTQADYAPLAQTFIPMAIWSMRSLILNSDIGEYKPTPIFHIDQRLWDMGKEVFQEAGVPEEYIIVYDPDIVPTSLDKSIMHLAAAPFLDEQLERFERVIVLDSDLFALANRGTGLLPVMDVALNKMPENDISLLRSWTVWNPTRDEYKNWHDHGQRGKKGFLQYVARYCNTTPDVVKNIMYPVDVKTNPRPFHNGAFISIPMRWLLANSEFRNFIRDVSGVMGNEEIAMAIWAIKRYLETGERWPAHNMQDYDIETGAINLRWDLDTAWKDFKTGKHVWAHLYGYNNILECGFEFAKVVGASDSEAQELYDKIDAKAHELQLNESAKPLLIKDMNTPYDFQPFPLRDSDKTRHVAGDVIAVCESVAKENRGDSYDGSWVVQHSVAELQALYELTAGQHDAKPLDGHVIQCGILCGGSALMLAQALKDTKNDTPVLAIDSYTKFWKPLRREFNWAYHEWRENRHEFRMDEHLTSVISTTQSFLRHFWTQPIRVVFIDSSHLYDETVEELSLLIPHIVPGGWLIVHDYFSDDTPGVARAVNEWLTSAKSSDFKFYGIEGLAIIQLNSHLMDSAVQPDATRAALNESTFDRFAKSNT